jgi:hypothetical protein
MNRKILVCGGRDFTDSVTFNRALSIFLIEEVFAPDAFKNVTIVHGAARGADTLAHLFCKMFGLKEKSYPITADDWDLHGRKAGILRNVKMLDDNPDMYCVVVFPGGRGTEHMKNLALKREIDVYEFSQNSKLLEWIQN